MSNRVVRAWRWWFAIPMSLRFAVGIWIALFLGVFGRVAVSKPEQQSVLPVYLYGAERLLAGELMYTRPAPPIPDVFRNPPAVAAFFVPFTHLDPKATAILWRLLGVSLYLLGLKRLIRDVLPPLSNARRAWVWILSAVLVIPAFNNAQINLHILATALLGTAAAARGRWWSAAVWLVVCGSCKVYTAAAGLLMSVAFPKRLAWRFAVAGLLIIGGATLAVEAWARPQSPLTEFTHALRDEDRSGAELSRAPKSWSIVVRVWFGVVVPEEVRFGVSLAVAAAMAGWVYFRAGSVSDGRDAGPSLTLPALTSPSLTLPALKLGLIWLTLFGPATEMNTYSVLAPVAGVLCVVGRWQWVARAGTLLLLVAVIRGAFPPGMAYPLHTVQAVGTALLLVAALGYPSSPRVYER